MNRDDIRDIAIDCVDEMVKEKIIPDCIDSNNDTEFEVQDIIVSKICEDLRKQEYSMEHFDDCVCDLFSLFLGEGFVSENNEQFFNDKDLVADFNYHLEGLKRLLQNTTVEL